MSETKENNTVANDVLVEEPVKPATPASGTGKGRGRGRKAPPTTTTTKRGRGKKTANKPEEDMSEERMEDVSESKVEDVPKADQTTSSKKKDEETVKGNKPKAGTRTNKKNVASEQKPEEKLEEKAEEKPEEVADILDDDFEIEPAKEAKKPEEPKTVKKLETDEKEVELVADDKKEEKVSDKKDNKPEKNSKTVTTAKANKSPRRKNEKTTKDEEEDKKFKSPKKKAKTVSKSRKSKGDKDMNLEEEDEEDPNEDDMVDDDDDDDDDEKDDPEDEDVEGKGYGHVLMFTRMPNVIRSRLVTGVKQIPDGYMTRNINLATHVVCDEPVRTIKLMAAILRGVWVVSSKWVLDSMEAKKWLPEASYEIQQFPGVKASREAHAKAGANEHVPGLFNGMSFVIGHTDHTAPTKSEMKELVLAGDGHVLLTKEIEKAQYYLSCPSRSYPRDLPETTSVITQSAFFDAISNYSSPVSTPASILSKKADEEEEEERSKDDKKEDDKKEEATD